MTENNQDNISNTEETSQGTIIVAGMRPITTGTLQVVDTLQLYGDSSHRCKHIPSS